MRILGLIPARGGSKGVPRKNSKLLRGKPLVSYSIETALACPALDKVLVSTDDQAIAEMSVAAGAEVPFLRPAPLASDESPTIDTVLHALHFLAEQQEHYDALCLLQPTVPFRDPADLAQAIRYFIETDADTLLSVREVPKTFHPNWIYTWNETQSSLQLASGADQPTSRRQDLPPAYFRDGSVYLTKTQTILQNRTLYGSKIVPFQMQRSPQINIDTPADWQQAEAYSHHKLN